MIDSMLQIPGAGLDLSPAAAGEQLARQIGTSEWLGPLAPVALSPFFGIAVLSGLATYGPEFLQQRSGLISSGSPLNNHYLFWTMATLAMLTSLPRFSKVSKPFALAVEHLESYASVIILVAVKFLSSSQASTTAPPEIALAGLGTVSLDTMMSIAAALNIVVINTVKLFFELMVWLVPFPLVDAVLEVTQKSVCVALMGLYCYSPTVATMLNLLMLTACALVFGWIVRRTAYYRHLIVRPLLARLFPSWFSLPENQFKAFSTHAVAGLPAYVPFTVRQLSPNEFEVRGGWLWRSFTYHFEDARIEQQPGFLADRLRLADDNCDISLLHGHRAKS